MTRTSDGAVAHDMGGEPEPITLGQRIMAFLERRIRASERRKEKHDFKTERRERKEDRRHGVERRMSLFITVEPTAEAESDVRTIQRIRTLPDEPQVPMPLEQRIQADFLSWGVGKRDPPKTALPLAQAIREQAAGAKHIVIVGSTGQFAAVRKIIEVKVRVTNGLGVGVSDGTIKFSDTGSDTSSEVVPGDGGTVSYRWTIPHIGINKLKATLFGPKDSKGCAVELGFVEFTAFGVMPNIVTRGDHVR